MSRKVASHGPSRVRAPVSVHRSSDKAARRTTGPGEGASRPLPLVTRSANRIASGTPGPTGDVDHISSWVGRNKRGNLTTTKGQLRQIRSTSDQGGEARAQRARTMGGPLH